MAANSSLQLTSLDFDSLKQNFINYLTSQSVFKDYNFKGSNINALLDVLTYNSYLNSFYLNMVASEMFLDSAQKLDSVVSHAKELNYVPRSMKSASANVNLTITTQGGGSTFVIPKGTLFTGTNSNGSFNFTTAQPYTIVSSNSTFSIENINLYEGTYVTDAFVVDYTSESQRFVLTNPNIDLDSLSVTVNENGSNTTFTRAETLYGLGSQSNVFFIQAAQNNQYEIVFGDGLFGRIPINLAVVSANYRVCKGTDADGVSAFTCVQDIGAYNSRQASVANPVVNSPSGTSANAESLDSIKFSAPRYFASQQRAVASDDYSSLILNTFGGTISDVNVYGGETLNPKRYGAVVVCLKTAGSVVTPTNVKNQVTSFLTDYMQIPTRVILTDPENIYIKVTSNVYYDTTVTNKLPVDIQGSVISAIQNFSKTNLEKFSAGFKFSRFIAAVDDADNSILSNRTDIQIIKRIAPLQNSASSFTLNFHNPALVESSAAGSAAASAFYDDPVLTSSQFTYVSNLDTYTNSYIRDDNMGVLVVYTVVNGIFTILNRNIGTIDYSTGMVNINNLVTPSYGDYISLYMVPQSTDISTSGPSIINIDINDVTVNVTQA